MNTILVWLLVNVNTFTTVAVLPTPTACTALMTTLSEGHELKSMVPLRCVRAEVVK